MPQRQLEAVFSGRVQGVGFRFTAERLARRFSLTGYVKNLADGKVRLAAEGEEKALQEFLKEIREAFKTYIDEADLKWQAPQGGFEGFGIRF